jgi:DNA polymerase III gamma/tau subunit
VKEFYRKYRPTKLKRVLGQDGAVKVLRRKWKSDNIPHAILLYGPYGTGKTTLARIVAKCLKCSRHDFNEKNAADYRGIDSIREIRGTVNLAPIDGDTRVWLLDEVHKATNDAQNAMLKLLEDPPDHAYFILCTTEPERLLSGIRQRCLCIKLNPISETNLTKIVKRICAKEKIKLSDEVLERLVEYANGSAREALQILDKIYELESDEQLEAIEKVSIKTATIAIARLLLNKHTKWKDIAPLLKELENEDPEQIRYMVLGYAKTLLLKKDSPRAFRMMMAFCDNFYDSKFSGVVAACYEILQNE